MRNLPKRLVTLTILLAYSASPGARGAADNVEREIVSPSPDNRFAFLTIHQPDAEPQRTCDLIERESGKVLLRVAQSDEGKDRLDTKVLWFTDSKRFAVLATYNHFGAELSVFSQVGGAFRPLKLPDISEPEIPRRFERGHEWKWTGLNAASAKRREKDGTLIVCTASSLHAINSSRMVTSQRTVRLGFGKSGKVTILESKQKVFAHDDSD